MDTLPSFARTRVLVIGDIMLDRYWYGDTARISPEAPVPVVRIGDEEQRLGGAANVALNLARLGAQTRLLGVVGQDEAGQRVRRLLAEAGIQEQLLASSNHPTIAKLRVMSRNQQLLRLDFEQSFSQAGAFDRAQLLAQLEQSLAQVDVLICSDYGKGSLLDIDTVIAKARQAGVPVLVDPKGANWSSYAGADLITPNTAEFETYLGQSLGEDTAALEQAAATAQTQLQLRGLLVTRSVKGMSLFTAGQHLHLPTQAREVFDVTGAGDTVIATLGACLAAGLDWSQAAAIANLAASIVISKLGTATVTPAELQQAWHWDQQRQHPGIIEETALRDWVRQARARGDKVVMTNGCFDLLHPGHIAYLEAARALGDWLIVAVNADESVRRLKGTGRPINDLDHRMQVLSGLAAVDWVVPFAETTPERLIENIVPDVLVKGGDYRPEDIVGGACVRAAGGQVRVLDYVPGFSSTAVIERLRHDSS